jgi:hypothetical protein
MLLIKDLDVVVAKSKEFAGFLEADSMFFPVSRFFDSSHATFTAKVYASDRLSQWLTDWR